MRAVYVPEPVGLGLPSPDEPSIFLAGPTPRSPEVQSWRPRALRKLADFPGAVYLPERRDGAARHSYDDQIQWETDALEAATCIMFWIPRELAPDAGGYPRMGALTTNVEFGMWYKSGKVVLGYPRTAQKMSYLEWHARKENIRISHHLTHAAELAMEMAVKRFRGEIT
jgi:hypothetical protein